MVKNVQKRLEIKKILNTCSILLRNYKTRAFLPVVCIVEHFLWLSQNLLPYNLPLTPLWIKPIYYDLSIIHISTWIFSMSPINRSSYMAIGVGGSAPHINTGIATAVLHQVQKSKCSSAPNTVPALPKD